MKISRGIHNLPATATNRKSIFSTTIVPSTDMFMFACCCTPCCCY